MKIGSALYCGKERWFLLTLTCLLGCGTTFKVPTRSPHGAASFDVLVLATSIQSCLKETKGGEFSLKEVIQKDSSGIIANRFEQIHLKSRAGYISAYFKRRTPSNGKIGINENERYRLMGIRWDITKILAPFDGEIRFDYGERFYRIRKVLINKKD
ncbi:hypothetical protein [Desertivirga arenae]|uniref:hypothetical protein n=1 Tax=Desertivirga arenae TaxID=2810309 RepID=UPI001A96C94F|nr:hypothetical protein [Pedobacter sp. SYSU D00823]